MVPSEFVGWPGPVSEAKVSLLAFSKCHGKPWEAFEQGCAMIRSQFPPCSSGIASSVNNYYTKFQAAEGLRTGPPGLWSSSGSH